MRPEDLKQFDMECLNEMRQVISDRYGVKVPQNDFLDELESIISKRKLDYQWFKKQKEGIVKGDVWECHLGKLNHKRKMHIFAYLYAEYDSKQEIVIEAHGHKEPFHRGKQVIKIKEWYIFPDGEIKFCNKDELHELVNNYGKPIYVISVKSMSNATH